MSFFKTFNILNQFKRLLITSSKSKLLLVSLPFAYLTIQRNHFCWFGFGNKQNQKLKPNQINNRINSVQYEANDPVQDRMSYSQLSSIAGYAAAVFDGHGGWQMSNYANKYLLTELNKILEQNKDKYIDEQQLITVSLKQAFDHIQNKFLAFARQAYPLGFGLTGRVGACALVVVVANNKVYCANAGDSQALLISSDKTFEKLNFKANANSPVEQQRLRAQFPNQPDIINCKNNNPKSCYIKGRLQPSRAFGDFRLKYPQFNNPDEFSRIHEFQPKIKIFTGPYITHQPIIKVVPLTKNHKYVVVACDGVWDELTKQDVTDITIKNLKSKQKIPQQILKAALSKAASDAKITIQELKQIEKGSQRRKIHDDISIIGIDLQNQIKN